MQVYLDDSPIPVDPPTLAAAIEAGVRHAEERGRIIIEARHDGSPISPEALSAPSPEPCEGEVRFLSADPVSLVRTTLLDVADALVGAKEDQQAASELLQVGKHQEAFERIGSALNVWENLRQVVDQGAALLGIDLAGLRLAAGGEARPVGESLDALAGRLAEVKRAIEAQDWTGLSDALAYDLGDEAERWRALLADFESRIAGAQ